MHPDRFDSQYIEDGDDYELDDEEDDVDAYEGYSDYDDDELSRGATYSRHSYSESTAMGVNGRRQRSISENNAVVSEHNEDNRRDHHNQLERKRRASIKTSYSDLREAIPSLRGSKASRAVILQRAVECIEDLVRLNRDHSICVETLKRQNDLLDSRVQELQRLVQRADYEEDSYDNLISCGSNVGSSSNNVSLRLIPSSCSNTNTPIYRYVAHDVTGSSNVATELTLTSNSMQPERSTSSFLIHQTVLPKPTFSTKVQSNLTNRTTATSTYIVANAVNVISTGGNTTAAAAAPLITNTNSAFSTISSVESTSVPIFSISQRSSPSSSSSSTPTLQLQADNSKGVKRSAVQPFVACSLRTSLIRPAVKPLKSTSILTTVNTEGKLADQAKRLKYE